MAKKRIKELQAQVDELEGKRPDEVGKQVYLGGHGLRLQINKTKPNTWFQEVSTAPSGKQTSMKLGYAERVSFADAEEIGRTFDRWARDHTMAECKDAAKRFRIHAKSDETGRGHASLRQLKGAWRKALRTTTDSLDQDRRQLARFKGKSNGGKGGGGEGKAHRKLKEFVKKTPSIVGLPRTAARAAESEYELPSGDSVDVMFCHKERMIAVEVKSKRSNIGDVCRGIFQCVKYQAVTEATFKASGSEPDVRSVLVLGGPLPDGLKTMRRRLGVEVIENVRPR